jgi:integrase
MKPHVRPKTWHEYNRHWELYIRPALANLKLNKLLPSHVESMTRGLLARGLSPRTAGHAQATLRAALKEAERHGLVARNVASLARMPRAPRKEVAPLSPQDAARLLQAAEGSRCEAALAIMLYLGLRIGETLGLKWEDINFEQRTLSVRRALIRTGGEWKMVDGKRKQVGTRLLFQEPKTARSRRILPIPAPLVETLLRQHAAQAGQVLRGDFSQDSGLVVTNTRGGPLEPRLVGKELDRLLASLGLPHLNVHGLRHTAASMLIACGYGLGQVQQILGHSNVSLTADLYGHLLTDAARDPLDRMASLLRPGDGPKKPVATSVATSGKIARPN